MAQNKAIIIGAGLSGLACALLLQEQGFAVTIYEKAQKLRNIGGGILLYPHGVRILKLLHLSGMLDTLGGKLHSITVIDANDHLLLQDSFSSFYQQTGNYTASVSRTDLQNALCAQLPSAIIRLHHECIGVKQHNDQVRVDFKNGVRDHADLVIGADGIHSVIRKIISKPFLPLTYRGICAWGGILSDNYCADVPHDSLTLIFGINKLAVIAPMSQHRQGWFIIARIKAHDLIKGPDKLSQPRSFCTNWSKHVDCILKAPQNEFSFATTIDEVSPMTQWVDGSIALIGDAAHAIGPVQGQGVSLGLEDAFILSECLKHHRDIASALKQYETIRKPIVDQFRLIENKQQELRTTDDEKIIKQVYDKFTSSDITSILKPIIQLINQDFFMQQLNAIRRI